MIFHSAYLNDDLKPLGCISPAIAIVWYVFRLDQCIIMKFWLSHIQVRYADVTILQNQVKHY